MSLKLDLKIINLIILNIQLDPYKKSYWCLKIIRLYTIITKTL